MFDCTNMEHDKGFTIKGIFLDNYTGDIGKSDLYERICSKIPHCKNLQLMITKLIFLGTNTWSDLIKSRAV